MRRAPAIGEVSTEQPVRQIVLVMQGGGALGAYQAGVYQGLREAGLEPDWVVGTSIGAINGAIIAGNTGEERLKRLAAFWHSFPDLPFPLPAPFDHALRNAAIATFGLQGFFAPNPAAWDLERKLGVTEAAFYSTTPLRETLERLVDPALLAGAPTRLTMGAVDVLTGQIRYFDTRDAALGVPHIMASSALPPGFPAVMVEGRPYWDGGVYSNTPLEVVLDDNPRNDSLVFTVNLWQPGGHAPETIWEVLSREKDIQYASRAVSHIARQQQIHTLRHVIRQLSNFVPATEQDNPVVRELLGYGCATTMHIVRMLAPPLKGDDLTKDIDFSRQGIDARWQAGLAHARRLAKARPWHMAAAPLQGVVVHESVEPTP